MLCGDGSVSVTLRAGQDLWDALQPVIRVLRSTGSLPRQNFTKSSRRSHLNGDKRKPHWPSLLNRKCVMEWEEPHDSALYCMQTDGNHMIAAGTAHHGVVRLWDKRKTRCLRMFQLTSAISSPVYSLRFNTSHLYAALASSLYALDFNGTGPRARR